MAADRWGSKILKSLYGRRFGLDDADFVAGPAGVREPFETLSAASTMENYGTTVITGSTATYTIQAPLRVGIQKEIINASSASTAAMAIVRSTAQGACTFLSLSSAYGSSADQTIIRLNLINVGSAATLRAISTSQWAVIGRGTTATMSISTSS